MSIRRHGSRRFYGQDGGDGNGGGGGFSPADIPDLMHWWDPGTGISTDVGVDSWTDRVGGLAILQASDAAQPTVTTFNGAPAIAVNGSQYLASAGTFTAQSEYSIVCMAQFDEVVAPSRIPFSMCFARQELLVNGDTDMVFGRPHAGGTISTAIGASISEPFVHILTTAGASSTATYEINGFPVGTLAGQNHDGTNSRIGVGAWWNGNNGFSGKIADCMYYGRQLTSEEKDQLGTWAVQKYIT